MRLGSDSVVLLCLLDEDELPRLGLELKVVVLRHDCFYGLLNLMRYVLGRGISLIAIAEEEIPDLAMPDDCLLAPFGFSDSPNRSLENRNGDPALLFIELFFKVKDVGALEFRLFDLVDH